MQDTLQQILNKKPLHINAEEVINENSKVPKYRQVVDFFVTNIGSGYIKLGDKIPSINDISEEFLLSRDTVEKAYKHLQKRGIITSVKGKGYYVSCTSRNDGHKTLMILNKLSDHKKAIYNAFMKRLGDTGNVDLQIHNSESKTLEKIIIENLGRYDYYVIMPHLKDESASVLNAIKQIPSEKLFLINKDIENIQGAYGCVYEDFEQDIYQALSTGLNRITRYTKLLLVFPTDNYYCSGIQKGFIKFCEDNEFDFEVIVKAVNHKMEPHELYIVIEESDLVEVVKKAASRNYKLGKCIGVIAYNDSPFKEILAGGISVLTTDFERMGSEMAAMILTGERRKLKNPFSLIMRGSL